MLKNDYKLLALDMDGTILTSDHQLTERVRLALSQVAGQGIPIILVSARSPSSMVRYADQIGLCEIMVALNGVLVVGQKREILHYTTLPYDDVQTILALCERYHYTPNLFIDFDWYTERMNAKIERQISVVGFRPILGSFSSSGVIHEVQKILVMGEAATAPAFFTDLERECLRVQASFSGPTYIEVTPVGVSKASGLSFVCHRLNIPPAAVVAVGDNFNDIEMIQFAGLGVAMGNAPDEVKTMADLIIGSHDEDGVADFVERVFLNGV